MLAALYLLLTLAFAGVLLALLVRPGTARAGVVWGLAACAGALVGQARAARVLASFDARPVTVTVTNGEGSRTLTLSARDAACVERAVRLHTRGELLTPGGPVPLLPDTRVSGPLPPQAVVEALGVRGSLTCPNLRALPERSDPYAHPKRGKVPRILPEAPLFFG